MRSFGRLLLIVLVLGIVGGGAAWWFRPDLVAGLGLPVRAAAPAARPPAAAARAASPVEIAVAETGRVDDVVEALGTLAGNESVAIAPEIAGRVTELRFREGERVERGAVLVEIDSVIARADLQQTRAALEQAQDAFDRNRTLVQRGAGTQVALEQATAQLATGRANVAAAEARLEKFTLIAPIEGVIGLRAVSAGTFVPVGQVIATLTDLDPIKMDFSIPELFLPNVRVGQAVEVRVDAVPDRTFAGEVFAIDPVVDASGRALRLRATIANADGALRPGLFARVTLTTGTRENAVLAPETALVASPTGQGSSVYVVDGDRARLTPVATGRRLPPGRVEITEGLEAGARVVVAGQIRLRDGATVEVSEPPPPAAQAELAR